MGRNVYPFSFSIRCDVPLPEHRGTTRFPGTTASCQHPSGSGYCGSLDLLHLVRPAPSSPQRPCLLTSRARASARRRRGCTASASPSPPRTSRTSRRFARTSRRARSRRSSRCRDPCACPPRSSRS